MTVEHLHPPHAPYQWPNMRIPRHFQAAVFKGMKAMGVPVRPRSERLAWISDVLGFDVQSMNDLSPEEVGDLIAELRLMGWEE